ncbi:TetR/AcrR family transcriptional regulator [Bacillus sp. 28A-2]|uniref:TetR/AcrR family transcriptional regulator n=1 Tax=Bacillus sp. 28A-2 TaxID=2772252 RepID=UPI001CD079FB|nr:TetR/AcrR family transcriptional regulator [Bacillus sp. 28A-2]
MPKGNMTKAKIADAAKVLFVIKGYTATSIEDIRVEAGVSKGLAYYHFKNKEEIYLYCLNNETQHVLHKWQSYISQNDMTATEKLYSLSHYFIPADQSNLVRSIPEFIESTNKGDTREKTLRDLMQQVIDPEKELINQIIHQGVSTGEFKRSLATEDLAAILYSCLTSFSFMTLLGYSEDEAKNFYKRFLDTILQGLSE